MSSGFGLKVIAAVLYGLLTPGHHAPIGMVVFLLLEGLEMKSDLRQFECLLSMNRTPEEEAEYLLKQYQTEAFAIAQDCAALFETVGNEVAVTYWKEVCECLKRGLH